MLLRLLCAASAALLVGAGGSALRAEPAEPAARIEALRRKLLSISRGLSRIMEPGGPLAGTDAGPDIAELNARIETIVRSTAGRRDAKSLDKLVGVMGSVTSLAKDISRHQMQLMQEGDQRQQDSLLLGVLMAKRGEPIARQLEVLEAPAFAHLRVTEAVLARKDMKTPLFQQVASLLDAHGAHDGGARGASGSESRGAVVARTVASLRARLARLEASARRAEAAHAGEEERVRALEKNQDGRSLRILRAKQDRENRRFQRRMDIQRQDIGTMRAAVDAMEHGDVQGVRRAEAALESSMRKMRSQSSGFLMLIQEGLRGSGLDCPYCAAQCVDRCHAAGGKYVACLAECQDAGT